MINVLKFKIYKCIYFQYIGSYLFGFDFVGYFKKIVYKIQCIGKIIYFGYDLIRNYDIYIYKYVGYLYLYVNVMFLNFKLKLEINY